MPERVPPGLGHSSKIVPPNPVPGAEISYTIPTGARFHILSVNFTLATDANVAVRYPSLQFLLNTYRIIQVAHNGISLAASLTYNFSYYPGASVYKDTNNNLITQRLSSQLYVSGKFQLTTTTANIQAADQYSNIYIWVAQWIEPG